MCHGGDAPCLFCGRKSTLALRQASRAHTIASGVLVIYGSVHGPSTDQCGQPKFDFVVVVAPPGQHVDDDDVRAFAATGGQGVNLALGVWHHPLIAIDDNSDFVVVDRIGPGDNCELVAVNCVLVAPSPYPRSRPE